MSPQTCCYFNKILSFLYNLFWSFGCFFFLLNELIGEVGVIIHIKEPLSSETFPSTV